jgi:hypothetical protein
MHDMSSCCLMKVTFFIAQKGGAFCAFLVWCCLLCCIHYILFTFNVFLLFESVFKNSKILRHWNLVNLVLTLKTSAKLVKWGPKPLVRLKHGTRCQKVAKNIHSCKMEGGTTFTSIYLQKVVSFPISFFLDAWFFLHQICSKYCAFITIPCSIWGFDPLLRTLKIVHYWAWRSRWKPKCEVKHALTLWIYVLELNI